MIYDIDSLLDEEQLEHILAENRNKKICVFGAGIDGKYLYDRFLHNYEIYCFLDNKETLWGTELCGITIADPGILKDLVGEVCVLIACKFIVTIQRQLEHYGLEKDRDFFDVYTPSLAYFRMKYFDELTMQYIGFIDRIPADAFKKSKREVNAKERIAVVCIATTVDNETWYSFTEFLLLKYLGYDVTLIVDTLKSFDDVIYFPKSHHILQAYTEYIAGLLREKFDDLNILFLNETTPTMTVLDDEIQEINRLARLNEIWQDASEDMSQVPIIARNDIFKVLLLDNYSKISYFLEENKFDSLHLVTALHKSRGLYLYKAKKLGMRVSSYDGSGSTMLSGTDFSSLHWYDLRKMLDGGYFDENEYKMVAGLGKKKFEKILASMDISEINGYEIKLYKGGAKSFTQPDVLIPMNIEWDGAALGVGRIFSGYFEWLICTINYLLDYTDSKILLREHPGIVMCKNYKCTNYYELIHHLYGDNPRIHVCRYNDHVNTYDILKMVKVVLPYSGTIGIEGALMNKAVITHTNCYYDTMDFVFSAKSKEDYFRLISEGLQGNLTLSEKQIEQAAYIYFCRLNLFIRTDFREVETAWMQLGIDELADSKGVTDYCRSIAENIPAPYINIKRILKGGNIE